MMVVEMAVKANGLCVSPCEDLTALAHALRSCTVDAKRRVNATNIYMYMYMLYIHTYIVVVAMTKG